MVEFGEGRGSEIASALLDELPDQLTCEPEDHATGAAPPRRRLTRRERPPDEGRIDWVLRDAGDKPSWHLAVEVRIGAGLTAGQLRTYHEHLRTRRGKKALMVLAVTWPQGGLLSPEDGYWLGTALWEHTFPRLRTIRPDDQAWASQWPFLVRILEARDDLGTPPVTWESLKDPPGGSKVELGRLADRLRPRAFKQFQALLKRRPRDGARHSKYLPTQSQVARADSRQSSSGSLRPIVIQPFEFDLDTRRKL
jgi:hypothetical protein